MSPLILIFLYNKPHIMHVVKKNNNIILITIIIIIMTTNIIIFITLLLPPYVKFMRTNSTIWLVIISFHKLSNKHTSQLRVTPTFLYSYKFYYIENMKNTI